MNALFQDATAFNQDISSWDVSNVTGMNAMFQDATAFNQDISSWDVSNVTTMDDMFSGVTLSVANYDALLIGWDALELQDNVTFDGGNSQYSYGAAAIARANIIAADNWSFTDGGLDALPSPLEKPDVIGSIEAWTDVSSRWAESSIHAAYNRIDWLRRHKGSELTSYQGIKLDFQDKTVNAIMNSTPNLGSLSNIDLSNTATSLVQNSDGSYTSVGNNIKTKATDLAINEAAKIRQNAVGSINPAFKPVIGDWSIWTEGRVFLGNKEETANASEQSTVAESIAIGFDRPTNDDGIVGFVLNVGQDNIGIGADDTNVGSENYSLSTYRAFGQGTGSLMESVIGLGHLEFDTKRTDGADTLVGMRTANQIFLSTTFRHSNLFESEGVIKGQSNFLFSPYTKLSIAHTRLDAFSETGGETALTYDKQSVNDATVRLGVDISSLIPLQRGEIRPYGKLEYNTSVSDTSATMHYSSENTDYTTNLDKVDENFKVEYGIDFKTKGGVSSSAAFTREDSTGSSDTTKFSDRFKLNVGADF